mgnify:CR=1 FL=1
MKVSAVEEYGLRCLRYLSEVHERPGVVTIGEIARAEGVTPEHVAKLVGALRRAGLVFSVRGMRGGVRLAREPGSITVADALTALSGRPLRSSPCRTGRPTGGCRNKPDCGIRSVWGVLEAVVTDVLARVTLKDLASGNGIPEACAAGPEKATTRPRSGRTAA